MSFLDVLGKKIKMARIEANMTQTELGRKVGTWQKSISRYESGKTRPSLKRLDDIATAVAKPLVYFF